MAGLKNTVGIVSWLFRLERLVRCFETSAVLSVSPDDPLVIPAKTTTPRRTFRFRQH